GVILYTLLSGYLPFYDDDDDRLVELVAQARVYFPAAHWRSVSRRGRDIVCRLLQKDSRMRLTAAEFLSHPWVLVSHAAESEVEHAEVSLTKSHGTIPVDVHDIHEDEPHSSSAVKVDHEHAKKSMRRLLNVHRDGSGLKAASESS